MFAALGRCLGQTYLCHVQTFAPCETATHRDGLCHVACLPQLSPTSFLWWKTPCRSSPMGSYQFRVGSRGRIADVESRPSFGVAKRSLVDHMPPLQACLLEGPREKERGSRKCAIGAVSFAGTSVRAVSSTEAVPGKLRQRNGQKAPKLFVASICEGLRASSTTPSTLTRVIAVSMRQ